MLNHWVAVLNYIPILPNNGFHNSSHKSCFSRTKASHRAIISFAANSLCRSLTFSAASGILVMPMAQVLFFLVIALLCKPRESQKESVPVTGRFTAVSLCVIAGLLVLGMASYQGDDGESRTKKPRVWNDIKQSFYLERSAR